jgi:hypothetical protein
MDNYELPIIYWDGADAFLGEEDYVLVLATATATNATWTSPKRDTNLTGGLPLSEDNRFLVTSIDTDLSDIETLYYEVATVENDSGDVLVELTDLIGDRDITFDDDDPGETEDIGDVTVTLAGVNGTTSGKVYLNFTSTSGTITYNAAVSETGLLITLPTSVAALNDTVEANITMTEANSDEDVGSGTSIKLAVKATSDLDYIHVNSHNLTAYDEEDESDVYTGIIPSELASTFTFDTSGDENTFDLEYFGKEVTAGVSVVAGGESSSDGSAGNLVVMDSEVDKVSSKNLIIVGGSCINSAAAAALGVAEGTCGAAFTAATGVGTGQFLLKSVDSPVNDAKIALVVAGWEIADTVAAADYLLSQTVDTSSVDKVVSSSSMEAVLA